MERSSRFLSNPFLSFVKLFENSKLSSIERERESEKETIKSGERKMDGHASPFKRITRPGYRNRDVNKS